MDTTFTVTDQVEMVLATGERVSGEIEDIIFGTDESKVPYCILVVDGEDINFEDISYLEKL